MEASTRPTTHGYSVSKGIPRLRKAICDWYQRRYAVELDPDSEAIVTIGSKEGLAHLMLATLDRGDTVLVPNPSYPIHIYGAVIAGANIRSVRMTPGVDFFEELERAVRESIPKPKMMVLGFPSNPTAQCVDLSFFERVVALAKEHDILVVHDLAYADITFDGYVAPSIMQVPGARDVAVEFFTMSKSYNMAGWRIGYMVGNRELVGALARIKSYHDYGTLTPIQVASIAALDGPQDCVNEIVAQYQSRRDVLARGLHEAGWNVEIPKASMYIWAQIPEPYRAMGSLEFSKRVLSDAKVAVSRDRLRRVRRRIRALRSYRTSSAPARCAASGHVPQGRTAEVGPRSAARFPQGMPADRQSRLRGIPILRDGCCQSRRGSWSAEHIGEIQ